MTAVRRLSIAPNPPNNVLIIPSKIMTVTRLASVVNKDVTAGDERFAAGSKECPFTFGEGFIDMAPAGMAAPCVTIFAYDLCGLMV